MFSVYAGDKCIYNDMFIDEGHKLLTPKLKLEDNSSGSFTATLPPTNVGYELVGHKSTVISVRRDNVEIWSGRVVSEKKDFWNQRAITCEGELGYLNDTIQPPAEYHDITVRQFLETMLNIHNAKVSDDKKFYVGVVTVTDSDSDSTDSIYRYTNYESTLACIKDKLIDRLKGHLQIRKVDGVRYLDYLKDYPNTNKQVLRFGKNLLEFTKNWDLTDLATVVVPRGKTLDESPIEALSAYLTVESVNGGSIYVASDDAVKEFGWIETVVDWNDVTLPENLLTKAKRYLEEYQFDEMTIELNALDARYLSKSEEPISLLDEIRCVSKPHGMDRYFPVTDITLPLDQPEKAVYILGNKEGKSLSASTNQASSEILKQMEKIPTKQQVLREAKENATEMIHTATHGNVVMNYDENGAYELLIMDTKDTKTAKKVWRWNLGGFGYSNNGYNGPYGIAMTMDGSIVADYITAGTMMANRIKGGQLIMGGYDNENGVIYVKNSTGKVIITIDCNGINVNNAFTVDTAGNISAFSISGNAVNQFNKNVEDSEALQKANEAIALAQAAAEDARSIVRHLQEVDFPYLNGIDESNQLWISSVEGRVNILEKAVFG